MADATWQTRAAGPLTFHYQRDSFAEHNLDALVEDFRQALASIGPFLGLKPDAAPPLDVFLVEFLPADANGAPAPDGPAGSDQPSQAVALVQGVTARREYDQGRLWLVVNSESPGDAAELEVAHFLVHAQFSTPRPEARIWFDGLAEHLAGRFGSDYFAGAAGRIQKLFDGGQLAQVTDLLDGYLHHQTSAARAAMAGFIGHLVKEHGWDRLRRFLGALRTDEPLAAFARVYGRPVQSLEQEWYREMQAAIQQSGQKLVDTIKQLLPFISTYRLLLAGIFATILVTIAFAIFIPMAIRFLVGNILGGVRLAFDVPTIGVAGEQIQPAERHQALLIMLGVMVFMFVLNAISSVRRTLLLATMGEGIVYDLRLKFYQQLHNLPTAFHRRTPNADLSTRFSTDIGIIQQAMTSGIVPMLQSIGTMLLFALVLLSINWKLSSVALVGLPVFAVVYQKMRAQTRDAVQERARRVGDVSNSLFENLNAQERIKLYGMREFLTERFRYRAQLARDLVIRISMLSAATAQTGTLITNGAQVLILTVGGWLVLDREINSADLMAFYVLLLQLYAPAGMLTSAITVLGQTGASLDRVKSILDMQPEADPPDAREAAPLREAIRVENVTFGYQRGKELLKGMSAEVPAGAKVAFVGPPGSGRSALMDLLPRLYDVGSGAVTWDGVNVRQLTRDSLRRELAVLTQEQYVFNVTIYDNIRYGGINATEEEVVAAARAAGLHDFIMGLPAGYDTQVNDRDTSLGLGHRQRLAAARVLLRPASVVLMDDALSALDAPGQRELEQALRGPAGTRTLVKIAQRVSAVTDCDLVYVMDGGAVVEQGRHEELTDRGGLYTQLVKDELGEGAVSGAFAAVRRLAKQAPFSSLPPEILEEVARLMLYAERGPGDVICRQGSVGDELYFIGKGEVEILLETEDGAERILGYLEEGEYFGEISFLRRVPRTATCRACTNCELHILRRQDFDHLMDRLGSDVTAHLDRTAQERIEATKSRLAAAEAAAAAG